MAIYFSRDIKTSFSGDIEIDSKGDLQLADALESTRSAINFVLRTDLGDYAPNPNLGCNLGTFIGERNLRDTHEDMEYSCKIGLTREVVQPQDLIVDVVPFSDNEAFCSIKILGYYLINDELVEVTDSRQSYSFPFIDGQIDPLDL